MGVEGPFPVVVGMARVSLPFFILGFSEEARSIQDPVVRLGSGLFNLT